MVTCSLLHTGNVFFMLWWLLDCCKRDTDSLDAEAASLEMEQCLKVRMHTKSRNCFGDLRCPHPPKTNAEPDEVAPWSPSLTSPRPQDKHQFFSARPCKAKKQNNDLQYPGVYPLAPPILVKILYLTSCKFGPILAFSLQNWIITCLILIDSVWF